MITEREQLQNCAEWNIVMRDRQAEAACNALKAGDSDITREHTHNARRHQRNIDSLNRRIAAL